MVNNPYVLDRISDAVDTVWWVSGRLVPDDFEVPVALQTDGFRLEPLGAEHNERDYEAWTSSITHIRSTPGFERSTWPSELSREENLADLVRHHREFIDRTAFTYSVLDGDVVVGCVYLKPSEDEEHDVAVTSWVRASRGELDVALWRTVSDWLDEDWPFTNPHYDPR